MLKTRITSMSMIIFLLVSSYAFAETGLRTRYTDDELVQIMNKEGYSAVEKLKEGVIRIKIDGQLFILVNQDDGDLQGYYGVSGVKVPYEVINKWNQTRRLSCAYLDSDRDPALKSDLLANGGISERHIAEFFRVFKYSVQAFKEFLVEQQK